MSQPEIAIHYDSPPPGSRPLRGQVTELRTEIERLRKLVSEMSAAADAAGLAFRNTDRGPALVGKNAELR